MLAGNVLARSVQGGMSRVAKVYYKEFLYNMNANENEIQSVLAFRELCFKFEKQRQIKYFRTWWRNKLKPIELMNTNRKITEFMLKNEK